MRHLLHPHHSAPAVSRAGVAGTTAAERDAAWSVSVTAVEAAADV